MDSYNGYELDKRCEEFKADPDRKRAKAVTDLVLQVYRHGATKPKPEKFNPNFELLLLTRLAFWCLWAATLLLVQFAISSTS